MHRLLVLATPLLLGVLGATADPVAADWPPEGVLLCTPGVCDANRVMVCTDGAGGAFVVWGDWRDADIYVQRVTSSGAIAPGWPADGVPMVVDPAHQGLGMAVPDGSGGVIAVWVDQRNALSGNGSDIYAQRILADGSIAPGWPVNGAPVTRAAGHQDTPVALADGLGGVFVTWDHNHTPDVYLQHLDAGGQPAPGWPADGLPVCTDPGFQCCAYGLAPDGAGGVFVGWHDERDGGIGVYAQRVAPDGAIAPGWPVNGARIVLGRAIRELMSDGAGGAYLSCATLGGFLDDEYHLQRFTGSGEIAPGWPLNGAPVCVAPQDRAGIRIAPDGGGGAILAWYDYRFASGDEVFALRMRPDGTRHPGWPVDGLQVSYTANNFDSFPELASDGMSGAYLSWQRYYGSLGDRVVVQRLRGDGTVAAGWPESGREIPANSGTGWMEMVEDGAGGAIVGWSRSDGGVRALRFNLDGPVAVLLSLAEVEATPERVTLRWQGPGAGSVAATVERRTAAGEWEPRGRGAADGADALVHEDRSVVPATRYAYRLRYAEAGDERVTAEIWVAVPGAFRTTLEGFRPNPAAGPPVLAFTLADGSPATLEVHDVAGRRVLTREVGSLGAGRHELRVEESAALAAGIYLVRLRAGGEVRQARGVIVR